MVGAHTNVTKMAPSAFEKEPPSAPRRKKRHPKVKWRNRCLEHASSSNRNERDERSAEKMLHGTIILVMMMKMRHFFIARRKIDQECAEIEHHF